MGARTLTPPIWETEVARSAESPMSELVRSFFAHKTDMSESSVREYRRYLEDFMAWGGDLPVKDALDPERVSEYVGKTRKRSVYVGRFACAILKSFASWLADEKILRAPGGASVLAGVKTPKVPREGRSAIDDDDVVKIMDAVRAQPSVKRYRDQALIQLLLGTGVRLNEARELKDEDVHLDPRGKSWIDVRWQTSKGFASRRIRLGRYAVDAMLEYREDWRPKFYGHGPETFFLTEEGKAFQPGGMQSWMGRLRDLFEASGVRGWMAHRMRHTWATAYHRSSKQSGLTVYDLRREGGWKDLSIPLRYTHDRPWEELSAMDTPIEIVFGRRRSA